MRGPGLGSALGMGMALGAGSALGHTAMNAALGGSGPARESSSDDYMQPSGYPAPSME